VVGQERFARSHSLRLVLQTS